mmetsp:Transcript_100670/g.260595  ORF Transcript_100670/g.260595 Transcript_100670/m.260595 type:complete len:214 (+) Transcript_100670:362-1003(+)
MEDRPPLRPAALTGGDPDDGVLGDHVHAGEPLRGAALLSAPREAAIVTVPDRSGLAHRPSCSGVHKVQSDEARVAGGHLEPLLAAVLRFHEHAALGRILEDLRAPHRPACGDVDELRIAHGLPRHGRGRRRGDRGGLRGGLRGRRGRRGLRGRGRGRGGGGGHPGGLDRQGLDPLLDVVLVETELEEKGVARGAGAVPREEHQELETVLQVAL